MAGATIDMLRDLGFALGPVVVGAVALSGAGAAFTANLTGADLPTAHLAAARQVGEAGGPIAVNSLPPGAPGAAVLTAVGMTGLHPHRAGKTGPTAPEPIRP
jgi:hypothetical protein